MRYRLFVCSVILLLSNRVLIAQGATVKNSIIIQKNKTPNKQEFYQSAIYRADMESYRLRCKDVILTFSEGFECVLLSAKSVSEKGILIDVNSYQTDFSDNFILPTFSITADGYLVALYQKAVK